MDEDLKKIENAYFKRIAGCFKTAQVILLLLLFLFVTVFTLTNSDRITYQNLYYFVKDFRIAVDQTESGTADGFAYATDFDSAFAYFKGGLAVVGRERLQILTATGGINTTDTLQFTDPGVSAAGNLLLVYAKGEHDCYIYNSFIKLYSETFEGKIRTAHMSESGAFSVVTSDNGYASAVTVYNRNFRKLNKYNLNSFAVSSPLSEDGKTVAILSYVQSGGTFETRLRLGKVGTDTVYCDYAISDAFPLAVTFTGDRHVMVLTDRGIHLVTEAGGQLLASFDGTGVLYFDADSDGIAVLLEDNSLRLYSGAGEDSISAEAPQAVRSLKKSGDTVFLRTDAEILRYGDALKKIETAFCTCYVGELLAVSDSCVLLCFNGEARYFRFEP